jgi:hypothetical protein
MSILLHLQDLDKYLEEQADNRRGRRHRGRFRRHRGRRRY